MEPWTHRPTIGTGLAEAGLEVDVFPVEQNSNLGLTADD